jgi:exodeoxyribonuclease VII large subunit
VRHYDARRVLAGVHRNLAAQTAAMSSAMRTSLLRQRSRIEQLEHQLRALSPVAILDRGYALIFDSSGKLVKNAAQVEVGDEISARLATGALTARVEKKGGG